MRRQNVKIVIKNLCCLHVHRQVYVYNLNQQYNKHTCIDLHTT